VLLARYSKPESMELNPEGAFSRRKLFVEKYNLL